MRGTHLRAGVVLAAPKMNLKRRKEEEKQKKLLAAAKEKQPLGLLAHQKQRENIDIYLL